jgi:hypothetical protein
MTNEQISNTFTHHSPFGDQAQRYERIRAKARELATEFQACIPPSREASLAFTNLQQAVMWANASIAINEKPEANEAAAR